MRVADTGFRRLIPETKGRSLEEMDIIFGSVQAEQRRADIEKEERVIGHEIDVPSSPEANSVRSDFDQKMA